MWDSTEDARLRRCQNKFSIKTKQPAENVEIRNIKFQVKHVFGLGRYAKRIKVNGEKHRRDSIS